MKTYKAPEVTLPESAEHALRVRHVFHAGWEQWYLLTGDLHWDSPECYLKLIRKHFRQAKARNALIIDNGDWFDAINSRDDPRGSKGGLRPEHLKLNYLDALVDTATKEFSGIADNLLYMGTGNHEQAVAVRRETDITRRFIREMNLLRNPGLQPIHRGNYTGWIRFKFETKAGSNFAGYSMKIEHGTGGNAPVTKGVIQTNRRSARIEGATFYVSGHIHEEFSVPIIVETLNNQTFKIQQKKTQHLQVASYKRDFRTDGVGTWMMMKNGCPKPIGGTWLRFYSDDGARVKWETQPTFNDYENLSDYLPEPRVVADDSEYVEPKNAPFWENLDSDGGE